jgi:hypothetical protein
VRSDDASLGKDRDERKAQGERALVQEVAAGTRNEADARLLKALIEEQYTDDFDEIRRENPFGARGKKRIGLELVDEERADESGSPVLDEVIRNETIALIRKHLPPAAAENVLDKLDSGEWTDDQARDCVAEYLES